MKHTIKTILLFLVLVIAGTGHVKAIEKADIIINVQPNPGAGTVTVTEISGSTVTISAEPTSGYSIDAAHILVEKMVDAQSRRRAPGLSSLPVTPGSGNTYSFDIPAGAIGAYVTVTFYKVAEGIIPITSLSEINDLTKNYQLTADVDASGFSELGEFSGTLDAAINPSTNMPYRIYNLSVPLFTTLTGTVKNLVLENVGISGHSGNTGAIACTANGDNARIYNVGVLSGSVGGTAYTGGLVGLLDGAARVINCYSYADITGGTDVGGIVGHNNVATASNNLKTMVFACMFYGDITGGSSIAPIYNGTNIVNKDANGVSNFNYFRLEAPYVKPTGVNYNCALGAEDRFLKRFEFYRHLLNSHRELAGWWATGTYSNSEMMKWVLEPSQLDGNTPYPILKASKDQNGKVIQYPSVVNIDAKHATTQTERNKGGKLGTLTVNIQMGDGAVYTHPGTGDTEAKITTSQLPLNITDKDPDHFNFNYYKVQLPYYNDVGTKNYTGNRVVTGWKIVSITVDGNETTTGTGGWSTGADATATINDGKITLTTPYNFADRGSTKKDLYSVSGRVFNQGAYWDVPEGVSAITIEPYWAKCVYLADPNADKVYNTEMTTGYDVSNVGGGNIYSNGSSHTIAGESQVVYTSMSTAIASSGTALFSDYSDEVRNTHTVYDYAVVLVGNYHHSATTTATAMEASGSKPYTVTSIDLDGDNEPDYSYILRFNGRTEFHPVRADFINIPGLGMAQKSTGGTGSYNFGIMIPKRWFEGTNTSLFRFTQFEYEHSSKTTTDALIVQGGVMEQWVSNNQKGTSNKIPYIHVGGNVWFKEFQTGCHQDKKIATKHSPISVTGGDYDEFYLTGLYRGDITSKEDNAECYINGGRFGTVCGAAMEGIGKANGANNTGNVTWQIQNADIKEFYAGGINAAQNKIVEGNITTVVEGGYIKLFCGGPKFGDMNSGKTVNTKANGTIFDTFFGAGYGGNSYSRYAPTNRNNVINLPGNGIVNNNTVYFNSWNDWLTEEYKQDYNGTYGGVSTQFNYQFLPMSDNKTNVARIFVDYVKFSLATTHNVTSTLTDCTITGNFYGGGSLGKVAGNVTSTLDGCTVNGNVFGAGFSASLPTVEVDAIGFKTDKEPYYYEALGTYRKGEKDETTTYTWEQNSAMTNLVGIDPDKPILYTKENLAKSNLGSVAGNVTLTIKGNSVIGTVGDTTKGNVFGGGQESYVTPSLDSNGKPVANTGNTEVNIQGNTEVLGNVFGGGDEGEVQGSTQVNIE